MGLTTCQTVDYSVIPNWTDDSLLPYVLNGHDERLVAYTSPYMCSIDKFYNRFCYTDERLELFKGFLEYRKYLYDNVFSVLPGVKGIQWVGGSFCEDAECSRKAPPHDIDVFTSFIYPEIILAEQNAKIDSMINTIERKEFFKTSMKIDSYYIIFESSMKFLNYKMKEAAFWIGLWSHTREPYKRKGFIQLSMDSIDDNLMLTKL